MNAEKLKQIAQKELSGFYSKDSLDCLSVSCVEATNARLFEIGLSMPIWTYTASENEDCLKIFVFPYCQIPFTQDGIGINCVKISEYIELQKRRIYSNMYVQRELLQDGSQPSVFDYCRDTLCMAFKHKIDSCEDIKETGFVLASYGIFGDRFYRDEIDLSVACGIE